MTNTEVGLKNLNNVFKVYKTIGVKLDQTAILISKMLECLGKTPYVVNNRCIQPVNKLQSAFNTRLLLLISNT